jgi:hypothetical protein
MSTTQLPIKRDLSLAYQLSLAVAFLIVIASLAGLLFPQVLYPSEDLRHAFVPNDVINLLIGLPILLVSITLARREKLTGTPFPVLDFGVVLIMGLICFIPFGLFLRGILKS